MAPAHSCELPHRDLPMFERPLLAAMISDKSDEQTGLKNSVRLPQFATDDTETFPSRRTSAMSPGAGQPRLGTRGGQSGVRRAHAGRRRSPRQPAAVGRAAGDRSMFRSPAAGRCTVRREALVYGCSGASNTSRRPAFRRLCGPAYMTATPVGDRRGDAKIVVTTIMPAHLARAAGARKRISSLHLHGRVRAPS